MLSQKIYGGNDKKINEYYEVGPKNNFNELLE